MQDPARLATGQMAWPAAYRVVAFVEARHRALALALAAAVVGLGAIYSFYLGDSLPYLDEQENFRLATNIAVHRAYTVYGTEPEVHRAPGYPLLLSVPIALGAGIPHLRLLNFVALALSLYFTYALVRDHASPVGGVAAALLVLCYPVLSYTAGTLFPQTIASFLLVLALFVIVGAKSLRTYLLGGVLFGLLLLTVPAFLLPLVMVTAWVWLRRGRRGFVLALAVLLPALLIAGLWSARNYAEFGSFVFIRSGLGFQLFVGNFELAAPTAGANLDVSTYVLETTGLNQVEQDAYFLSKALEWIGQNKGEAARLYGLKLLNYFNFRNELHAAAESSVLADIVMLITYWPLLAFGIARVALARRFPLSRLELLLIALYLSDAVVSAFMITRIRYRLPFDWLLIALVAMFLARVAARRRQGLVEGKGVLFQQSNSPAARGW